MTWRLRDTRLHELLDEVTRGEFSKKLIEAVKSGSMVVDLSSGSPKLSMHFVGDDIEDVPGYHPFKWNEYPEVRPPKGVWMRVEGKISNFLPLFSTFIHKEAKACARVGEFCGEEQWLDTDGNPMEMDVKRFRPWED